MNHKQKKLLNQVSNEMKQHYPDFQVKVLSEQGDTVRIAIRMPEDDDQEWELSGILAKRLTEILVDYGYYFWVTDMAPLDLKQTA